MEIIKLSILLGQSKVTVNGIEFTLPLCKEREQKKREQFATNKANELIKLIQQ